MLCYKDMTFCVNAECTKECHRRLTPVVQSAARKWFGSDDAPIAVSSFNCSTVEESDDKRVPS